MGIVEENNKSIITNLATYREYILYYARTLLKQRVAGNYLGLLWLYIQPLMFMLIYTFVVKYVFKNNTPNFNVFVLIGLNAWTLFQRTLMTSATAIVRNKSIFEQVYFHKFVYPTIYLVSYIYEFFISTSLVFVLMFFAGMPFTWHVLEAIPVLITCILFTYACALICAHIGVYLYDLANILEFSLRFLFYLTPIMWNLDTLNLPYVWVFKANPMAIIISSFRNCFVYCKSPPYLYLIIIAALSCAMICVGYSIISKHENSYARII